MPNYISPPQELKPGSTVWAYLRDSGGDGQEQSIPQQKAEIQEYCQEHGLLLIHVFADGLHGTVGHNKVNDTGVITTESRSPTSLAGRVVIIRNQRQTSSSVATNAEIRAATHLPHSTITPAATGAIAIRTSAQFRDGQKTFANHKRVAGTIGDPRERVSTRPALR